MTYRDWMAWPPALGWELKVELYEGFFKIGQSTDVGIPASIVYGPALTREVGE